MGWRDLTEPQKAEFYARYKADPNEVVTMADEVDMNPLTLRRRLQEWAQTNRVRSEGTKEALVQPAGAVSLAGLPSYDELFSLLKKNPMTLNELSSMFDRSRETVLAYLRSMQEDGWAIQEERGQVAFNKRVKSQPPQLRSLADDQGQVVTFATVSDTHAGSIASQPTALRQFMDIAYHEYDCRVVLVPGDLTTGVNGYRGQEYDMVPYLRVLGRNYQAITEQQVKLANLYFPEYRDLKYYVLGGNHDYWHITNAGIDAVYRLCRRRDDMVYLGYDLADIPLTDQVDVRLWHPSGGVPAAFSGKLQKAVDQFAYDELSKALAYGENPRLRIVLAGHVHVEVKFQRGPILAAHTGCFEGWTNYLKRGALVPQIGGGIWRVWLTDGGQIQRVEYTFITYPDIKDDWANWPEPSIELEGLMDPDEVDIIFRARNDVR